MLIRKWKFENFRIIQKKFSNRFFEKDNSKILNFCFENFKEDVKIGVIFDIGIKHQSVGEVNEEWDKNRIKFIEKEVDNLPTTSELDIHYIDPFIKIKNDTKNFCLATVLE